MAEIEEQEIRGQEIDEEEFYSASLLMDIPFWCELDNEVLIQEYEAPICPVCGGPVEEL